MTAGLRIGTVAANRYEVVSTGRNGEVARYWVDPNSLRCDCAAGRRRTACKHLRLVLDHLEDRRAASA